MLFRSDRLCIRLDVERVLSQLPRHTRHVFWFPCEDVPILTEEADELAFLFLVECPSDSEELAVQPVGVEHDLLGVTRSLELCFAGWPL